MSWYGAMGCFFGHTRRNVTICFEPWSRNMEPFKMGPFSMTSYAKRMAPSLWSRFSEKGYVDECLQIWFDIRGIIRMASFLASMYVAWFGWIFFRHEDICRKRKKVTTIVNQGNSHGMFSTITTYTSHAQKIRGSSINKLHAWPCLAQGLMVAPFLSPERLTSKAQKHLRN